ncbi:MAG: YtxH domain-containing protein, partial [Chloroflexi bacterium]|nr:YtxH domain-containing protein [Chloroflexota bacterium]
MNNTKNVLIGLLIGGLAGAAAMLLFTPQSGKRTRAQI